MILIQLIGIQKQNNFKIKSSTKYIFILCRDPDSTVFGQVDLQFGNVVNFQVQINKGIKIGLIALKSILNECFRYSGILLQDSL